MAHAGESAGDMGWGSRFYAPLLFARLGLGVPKTSVEVPIRAISHVKAGVLRKNVEIRRLAYIWSQNEGHEPFRLLCTVGDMAP